MRKCPNCGYEDNPLWENCRFKRDLDLMRLEDFTKEYPDLIKLVMQEKFVRHEQFVYHKTGKYVLRKEPADFRQPFWEHFEAHYKRKTPIANWGHRRRKELQEQTKL